MSKEIFLPKTFDDRNNSRPECKDRPKISYSQYSSYSSEEYQDDYYVQYFSGIPLPSGDFALYGGNCGEFIEHYAKGETVQGILSAEDVEILKTKVDYPDNCVYEDEIIVDCGEFVVEGYADRTWYKENKQIEVRDYKTLNIDKKSDYYASEEYSQTALYCYQKEKEGYKVVNAEVFGLGRKGSSLSGSGNFKMRLSGETVIIPTPYTHERGEKTIEDIRKVVHQISDEYKIFLKYFPKRN